MVGVDPSTCTEYTLDASTWSARSTSGSSLRSESRSERVWRVTARTSRSTRLQSPLQRPDCRWSSRKKSCWRRMRAKSPYWSWRKRTKLSACLPRTSW